MIIGYSVLYVNEDINIKDVLWDRRVVYSTWEKAMNIAREMSNDKMERREGTFIVSLIKAESRKNCETNGSTIAFLIKDRQIQGNIGEVNIVPVYDE